jgi:hypothetical protein
MYKLELVDDSKLQALVGKRVEVMGRVDADAGDSIGRTSTGAGAGTSSTGAPGATSGNPGSAGNTGSRAGAGSTGVGAGAGATAGDSTGAAAPGSAGQSQTARQSDQSIGPDRIELPEFEVTSIREIAGTCAATPAGR